MMEIEAKKKRSKKKRIVIFLLSAVVLLLLIITVIIFASWMNVANTFIGNAASENININGPDEIPYVNENDQKIGQRNGEGQPVLREFKNDKIVNILLMGIDTSEAREERNMGWRSDMLLVCTINFEKQTIMLTTIPRDTQTNVYHVDEKGNATKIELTKINHAYAYGGGPKKYGAQNEMLAVKDYLSNSSGIKVAINYYVSIDLDNAPKLADQMGGIPVTLDVDFPGLGHKGDRIVLNSENTDFYLQERYNVGGDISRGRHHEQFVFSLIQQIKNKGAVNSAVTLFSLLTEYVKTDLNLQQVIALAGVLDNTNLENLDYKVIDGDYKYIKGVCYYLSDKEDVKKRVEYLMQ